MDLRIVIALAGMAIVSLAGAMTLLSWWPFEENAIGRALMLCGLAFMGLPTDGW